MSPQEYLKARNLIELERQSSLDALNKTWELFNKGKPLPKPIEGHADAVNAVRGWRPLAYQIINKIPIDKEFTIREIQSKIEEAGLDYDQPALSTYLKKLAEEGELVVVEQGKGRRATVYVKQ